MPERDLVPTPKTFAALVKAVREALVAGQARADRVYLESYHLSGRLIDAHILFFKARADYGARVIPDLAEALGCGDRLLYRCLQFAREYPILSHGTELGWSHYRLLMEVSNKAERQVLESAARKNHWSAPELERRVRAHNAIDVTATAVANDSATPSALLVPKRGTAGLHPIVARNEGLAVDLGFKLYRPLSPEEARRYSPGDIVRLAVDGTLRRDAKATKADLFTYPATLRRVIDGDTLLVAIAVAPGLVSDLELRLRGLDCAEMSTPEGKAAKRFVQTLFDRTTAITITTTKPDKYDRYVADVFIDGDFSGVPGLDAATAAAPLFLNNVLLSLGHARRYDGAGPKPWETL